MKSFMRTTLLLGLALAFVAACGGGEPEGLEILVKVEHLQLSPETVRVKQGDMVTLKIDADEAGEFHLHGYDIKKDVAPAQVADLYFVADATGRFKITFHGEEATTGSKNEHQEGKNEEHKEEHQEGKEINIGFLEVQPR